MKVLRYGCLNIWSPYIFHLHGVRYSHIFIHLLLTIYLSDLRERKKKLSNTEVGGVRRYDDWTMYKPENTIHFISQYLPLDVTIWTCTYWMYLFILVTKNETMTTYILYVFKFMAYFPFALEKYRINRIDRMKHTIFRFTFFFIFFFFFLILHFIVSLCIYISWRLNKY